MNAIPKMARCSRAGDSAEQTCCGRRGLPAEAIAQMYADYQAGLSLEEVGAKYDRTRQSVFELFTRRGLKLRAKVFQPKLVHNGRAYTPSKGGYLRDTVFRTVRGQAEKQLHRVIWQDAHGPIPAGHNVGFRDGNRRNVRLENLVCLPIAAMSGRTATGHNHFTKTAPARLSTLLQGGGSQLNQLRRK